MKNAVLFDHAVTMASAFIANGDIRLAGNTREDSQAMDMVHDLVISLYRVLDRADQCLN